MYNPNANGEPGGPPPERPPYGWQPGTRGTLRHELNGWWAFYRKGGGPAAWLEKDLEDSLDLCRAWGWDAEVMQVTSGAMKAAQDSAALLRGGPKGHGRMGGV